MFNKTKTVFFTLLLILLSGCTYQIVLRYPVENKYRLQQELSAVLEDPNLQFAHIGIYVEDLQSGEVIFRHNIRKLLVPASNMKLFTSAAALVKLGPDFHFLTEFYYGDSLRNGHLQGDLIVRGKGDPTIGGRFYGDSTLAVFEGWADSLHNLGINTIEGDLVGDVSYFSGPPLRYGWEWDDEPFYYAPQIDALSFNENCVDLTISAGKNIGDSVEVGINPLTDYVRIINTARTVSSDSLSRLRVFRERGQNVIFVQGTVKQGQTLTESITVERPALYFLQELKKVLFKKGIEVQGDIRITSHNQLQQNPTLKQLFAYASPSLKDIVRELNKKSNNFYAEQILSTLGAEILKEGSAEKGREVVTSWLSSMGVAKNEFIMADGSGLARKNMIAPIATATLLRYMYHRSEFTDYLASLPIAGVDGTISRQLKGTVAEGRIFAKTGTVTRVRALSGYVKTTSGRMLLFVTMFNNYPVPTSYIKQIQDRICLLLSTWDPASDRL
ncbi:MAG TPA: D-alanyl-D-alanine carboxypeptidase/D-alanyl-D-alanine-endopeptidase [Caldithrix abyssi]|uniref:D-alanyl-D-alanine carboxypeptidase/D-alanyl-D-alanine-endopeptidase n=1 Tax=Caldithrix abyssi TaxID=187145 RepID=A0A7V4U2F0_CALAY|nr:D-alanyl-D-alanine carboxypeptidase/D-alanyl-D-alanine-endopeptidase [Caldithrix abyssi]